MYCLSGDHGDCKLVGYNYRMCNIVAGIGRGQMDDLECVVRVVNKTLAGG